MLILSRKCDEQIVIGEGIIITVVAIRGGKVRIGIEAPADVSVCRRESIRGHAEAADQAASTRETGGPSEVPNGIPS